MPVLALTMRRRFFFAALAIGLASLAGAAMADVPADAEASLGDRIAQAAAELASAKIPYVTGNLGGPFGPEEAGLPASGLDCMTFVEAALMRTQRIEAAGEQRRWLQRTRYGGAAPSYCTRAHYLSDWQRRNAQDGWIGDVTPELAKATGAPLHEHRWTRSWMRMHALDPQGCTDDADHAPPALAYVQPADYARLADAVRPGDLLVFVARDAGLDSVHVAIAQPGGGLAMASSISGGTVLMPSWVDYARERRKFLGVRVFRLSDLPASTPDAATLSAFPSSKAPAASVHASAANGP